MKSKLFLLLFAGLVLLFVGCATKGSSVAQIPEESSSVTQIPEAQTSKAIAVSSRGCSGVDLDTWLGNAIKEVETSLKTTMRGRSFIIVAANEDWEQMSPEIDGLTKDIRAQLARRLRGDPAIKLVTRRPVEVLERPEELKHLDCAEYANIDLFVCIRVRAKSGSRADVEFFALDLANTQDPVVRGFSVYTEKPVCLTPDQARLLLQKKSDLQLKGLEYLPFTPEEMNKVGAYLAKNLTCKYRERYHSADLTFYVDKKELPARDENIGVFLAMQLQNYYQGLRVVSRREEADLVISLKQVATGKPGMYQMFATTQGKDGTSNLSGINTNAYYKCAVGAGLGLSGKWKILSGDGLGRVIGNVDIHKSNNGLFGAFYYPNKTLMSSTTVMINLESRNVAWEYWDPNRKCLIQAAGTVDELGKSMRVRLKGKYCDLNPNSWLLSRL